MTIHQTSASSYAFRKGYDYFSYLETKSHFDRLEITVDAGIKNLIASTEELAKSQVEEVNGINDTLIKGFDRLAVSLSKIETSITTLSAICEHGFGKIDLQFDRLNETTEALLRAARTPDQTWALEQYSISKDAFQRNLFEEALDYINRAISGYGDKPGYRLEHKFYMLRGLIRLGNYQNFLPSIVNLDLAIQDFLLATKYAEHVARKDCSKAFELAGWASYCSGKMQDAERNFYRALEFDGDNGESKFLMSKILFHAGDTERAADQFAEALRCDHKYGLRAGSDDDFLKHRANVEACINEYRIEVQNELYRLFEPVEQNLIIKHEILSSHGLIDGRHQIKFFSNTKGKISSAPLADLIAMKSPLAEKLKDLTDEIATGKKELKKRADYLRHEKGKPFPWEIIPVLAGVLWVIGIVWFSHDVYLKNDHPIPVILLTIFFGPLAGALISAVGTAVLGTIMFAVHFLIYGVVMRMNNIEAATKIERDLPRL